MKKTNALRILDLYHINYEIFDYSNTSYVSGKDVCNYLHENPNQVFKTLVTYSKSNVNYVFVVPVCCELDLRKAANCVCEKWIELIPSKDLLSLTGYIHGGCSPIGMKKKFKTVFDESINNFEYIYFSGGSVGLQIRVKVNDISKVIDYDICDIGVMI